MSYVDLILSHGPVGYWRLGEASGTVANDLSGNGHHGTYTGGVTLGQPGAILDDANSAAMFDGTNDFVFLPNTTWPIAIAFTIEVWNKVQAPVSSALFRLGAGSGAGRIYVHCPWADGNIYFDYYDGLNSYNRLAFPFSPLGQFAHVVFRVGDGTQSIYLKGVRVAQRAATFNTALITGGRIGTEGSFFHKGVLDEFAIYNYALTPEQILAHYTAGTTPEETERRSLFGSKLFGSKLFGGTL